MKINYVVLVVEGRSFSDPPAPSFGAWRDGLEDCPQLHLLHFVPSYLKKPLTSILCNLVPSLPTVPVFRHWQPTDSRLPLLDILGSF